MCRFYRNLLQDRNVLHFDSKFQLFSFVCELEINTTMELDLLRAVFTAMSDEDEFDIGKALELLWERLCRGDGNDKPIARFLVEIYTDCGCSLPTEYFLRMCFFQECPDSLFAMKLLLQKYQQRLGPHVNSFCVSSEQANWSDACNEPATDPFAILSTGEYSEKLLNLLQSDDHSLAKCTLEILNMMPTLNEVNNMLRQIDDAEPAWGEMFGTTHLFLFLYYTISTVNMLLEEDTDNIDKIKKSFIATGGFHHCLKAILEFYAHEDQSYCGVLRDIGFLFVEQDEWVKQMTDEQLIEWFSLIEVLMNNHSKTADMILEKNDRVELLILGQKSIKVSNAYTSIVKQASQLATGESRSGFLEFLIQHLSSFSFLQGHYQFLPQFFEIMLILLQGTFTCNKDLFMKLTVFLRTCLAEVPLLHYVNAPHTVNLSSVFDILALLRPPPGDKWAGILCHPDLIECILGSGDPDVSECIFYVDLIAYQRFLLFIIPLENIVIENSHPATF